MWSRNLIVAVLMTAVTTLILGVIYPLAITGLAQVMFPDQANGQRIERNGTVACALSGGLVAWSRVTHRRH